MMSKFRPQTVETAAAEFFSDLKEILSREDLAYVGLPGGLSMDPVFSSLAAEWPVEWISRVRFFLVDERISPNPRDSNLAHLEQIFFGPLRKRIAQDIHILLPPVQGQAFGYPRSDLVLLSSGDDGHVASLFPGQDTLLNEEWRYLVTSASPKPPSNRVSLSL